MLEELQHNYPLELLMALSDAAIGAVKVLTSFLTAQSRLIGGHGKGMCLHGILIIKLPPEGCGLQTFVTHYPVIASFCVVHV